MNVPALMWAGRGANQVASAGDGEQHSVCWWEESSRCLVRIQVPSAGKALWRSVVHGAEQVGSVCTNRKVCVWGGGGDQDGLRGWLWLRRVMGLGSRGIWSLRLMAGLRSAVVDV